MRIKLNSIFVDDQDKAKAFYADVLGFQVRHDIPAGGFRWITLVAPDDPDGAELVLEPVSEDFARDFQSALFERGIPITAFEVDDLRAEHARLRDRGVVFSMEPTSQGPVALAVFADTCGNHIQLIQPLDAS